MLYFAWCGQRCMRDSSFSATTTTTTTVTLVQRYCFSIVSALNNEFTDIEHITSKDERQVLLITNQSGYWSGEVNFAIVDEAVHYSIGSFMHSSILLSIQSSLVCSVGCVL